MSDLSLRRAEVADVAEIVQLLADDPLGRQREDVTAAALGAYLLAFDAIDSDPNQALIVASQGDNVVGTMQLTFIPGLSRGGAWRGQIEAVRVAREVRGLRIGEEMIRWAINQFRTRECSLVQLASDKTRLDAHRFYERLGFQATHVGYKLVLD